MSCGRSICVLAFLFSAIVGGCSAPRALRMTTEVAPVAQAKIRNDISASLDRQVKAWNDGDVDGFMRGYWRDAKLTFLSGGTATFGWDATLARYHRRYPNREAMGSLTFSELHIEVVAPTTAIVWGRWHLNRTDPVGGLFTLVFRKHGEEWLVAHDHTSMDDKHGHASVDHATRQTPCMRTLPDFTGSLACIIGVN